MIISRSSSYIKGPVVTLLQQPGFQLTKNFNLRATSAFEFIHLFTFIQV